jgi:hypothetical protein
MGVVALLAAVVGAVLATLAGSSQAPAERRTTDGRSPVDLEMARVGESAAVEQWRVLVQKVETDDPEVPTRVAALVTVTNASNSPRAWLASEQVSLRYRPPAPSGTTNDWYSVVSPDTATGGNFEVAPGSSFDVYYTWALPIGSHDVVLRFRSSPQEGGTQEVSFDDGALPAP